MFRQATSILSCLFILCFFLVACASSDVSRSTSSSIDRSVQSVSHAVDHAGDSNLPDTVGNANQAVKGAVLGGVAGAAVGALSPPIGVIPGTAAGIILGAGVGSYIDAGTSLKDQLENRGANIIVLGDQVLIILPSARIFNDWTSTIKPQAYSTLALTAKYINQYTKILVKVSVYTDKTGSKRTDLALSQQQADQIVRALQTSGVDARVLYAQGYGGTHLVQPNTMGWDSDNYRIEITLENLYV